MSERFMNASMGLMLGFVLAGALFAMWALWPGAMAERVENQIRLDVARATASSLEIGGGE